MVIKLTLQLVWEAAILPTIRFIIGYAPFIFGVIAANELSIKYFIANIQDQLADFLGWYIPLLLVVSFAFGVMAPRVKKIHPIGMSLMFLGSIFAMRCGVVEMQTAFYHSETPDLSSMLVASVFAVATIYCVSLMMQRVWVDILPRRKRH